MTDASCRRSSRQKIVTAHLRLCCFGAVLFVGCLICFSTTVDETKKNEPRSFRLIHVATSGAFLLSIMTQGGRLLSDYCHRKWRHQLEEEYHTYEFDTGNLVIMSIQIISFTSHVLLAMGSFPAVRTLNGRRYHVVRWAEWVATVPMIMVLIHSYEEVEKSEGIADRDGTVLCMFGDKLRWLTRIDVASVICQSLSTALGSIVALYPLPLWCNSLLLLFAVVLYLNIFYVLYVFWNRYKCRVLKVHHNDSNPYTGNIPSLFLALDAHFEQLERTKQDLLVILVCAVLWTTIVATFFLGLINAYSTLAEGIAYAILDAITKCAYMSVLSDVALTTKVREQSLRAVLKLERVATDQRRNFLRFVMHEVRVPLHAVKLGITSALEDITGYLDESDPPLAANLQEDKSALIVADRAINVMSDTLNDVLSFSAIEEGRLKLHCEAFWLAEMLDVVVNTHTLSANEKDIQLMTSVEDALQRVQVYGDHRRIGGCISNFLSNAIKFSRSSNARVEVHATATKASVPLEACSVECRPANNISHSEPKSAGHDVLVSAMEVQIEVKDNGIGISEDDAKHLFKPFSQIRPGELQNGRGSGLGLMISKQIIEKHSGVVGVDSTLGVGSTFYVRIPLAIVRIDKVDGVAAETSRKQKQAKSTKLDNSSLHTPCALIVDDAASNRTLFARLIGKLGFIVSQAEDGVQAVRSCGIDPMTKKVVERPAHAFDVVFMDSVMPNM